MVRIGSGKHRSQGKPSILGTQKPKAVSQGGMRESEAAFSTWVEALLETYGFVFYHVYEQGQYARRSTKGFPDILAIKGARLLVAELKSETGTVTQEQAAWLDLFRDTGTETYLWRPSCREEIQEIILLGHSPNLIEREIYVTAWFG